MIKKTEILDLESALRQGFINFKVSFKSVLPQIVLLWILLTFMFYYELSGIVLFSSLSGMLFLSIANEIYSSSYNFKDANLTKIKKYSEYFLSGLIISLVIYPLLAIGYAIFVLPSVLIFSFIMFTWSISVKKKLFAFDALTESFDTGKGSRAKLFLMSLVFFATEHLIYNIFSDLPVILSFFIAVSIPLILSITDELHEQMEKK